MTTPKYKLTYFDIRGFGESLRWQFVYTSTPFEDERIPLDYIKWFTETKSKYASTLSQLPILQVAGKPELTQSRAVSGYLADELGLAGETSWERARANEIISILCDLFYAWRDNIFALDAEKKAAGRPAVEAKFRQYYEKLSKLIEENGGDYAAGKKITHADFWLANFLNIWDEPMAAVLDHKPVMLPGMSIPAVDDLFVDLTKEFPVLREHKERITSIPQIKAWIQKRSKTVV